MAVSRTAVTTYFSDTAAQTSGVTTSFNLPAGALLVVRVMAEGDTPSAITFSVSDTAGNTFTARNQATDSGGYHRTQIFDCVNTSAHASNQITVSLSGDTTSKLVIDAEYWTGGTFAFVGQPAAATGTGTTPTTASFTNSNVSIAAGKKWSMASYTAGSGWDTSYNGVSDDSEAFGMYRTDTPGGSIVANATVGTSDVWTIVAATYSVTAATIDQDSFAFGDDDGSESGHTLGTTNANYNGAAGTKTLRALLQVASTAATPTPTLYYQNDGSGGYTPVPVGSGTTYSVPTWQSSATPASGTGSVTWPLPSSFTAGDLIIWIAETANEAVPNAPTGATLVDTYYGTGTAAGTTATRLTVYAKIATGSETTNSAGDAGNHTLVSSFAIRGAHQTLATALHVATGNVASTASTSVTFPGGTTTVDNCLIINIVANATDTTTAQGSGWANANLGSVTERLDFGTSSGNGGGLTVITGTLATAGSIGGTTGTLATSSVQGRMTIAIRPPADVTNETYISTSSNVASGGEATTQRIGSGTFSTGRRWDDENGSDTLSSISSGNETEVEWVLTTSKSSGYIEFRVYDGSTALDTYTVTPKWTIGGGGSGTAEPTGVSGTGSAGDLSGINVNMTLTSLLATGVVGTLSASGAENPVATPSGVAGTGSVGSLSVDAAATQALSGVSSTGSAGDVSASASSSAIANISGVSGSGAIGAIAALAYANAFPTGVNADGQVGALTASGNSVGTANPPGVSGTGSAGTLSANGDAAIGLSGVAASGAIGTLIASSSITLALTGLSASGQTGTLSVTADALASLSGNAATGAAGNVSTTAGGSSTASASGVSATGQVGTLTYLRGASLTLAGIGASGQVGSISASGSGTAQTTLAGVSASSGIGTITASSNAAAVLLGVSASGDVGNLAYQLSGLASISGVVATGYANTFVFFPPTPDPNRIITVSFSNRTLTITDRSRSVFIDSKSRTIH